MPCRAPQDGPVMVESSDKTWSTGEGNGKPLQYSCLENPMNSMKRQKDRRLRDALPRSVDGQYAPGEEWRNFSRKNEEIEPKQKQHPAVDVTGDGSKVQCCTEQYCIGTWNVRSMNQGKLEVVKQAMARVNINILLTMPKPLIVWIKQTENFLKRWDTRPPYLPPEKSVCRSRSNSENWTWNNRLVPNWERSTSRFYPAYLTYMHSTS